MATPWCIFSGNTAGRDFSTMTPKRLLAIDVFAGCGGLTEGLKQAGFSVVGAIEIDRMAATTYAANHPEVHLWRVDVRKLSGAEIRRVLGLRKGRLDLLAGCPPCQGFSSMRTRNGKRKVRDKRNDLVFDYLRLVKALKPKAVMMENVPALAENQRMKKLAKKLAAMGYNMNGTPVVLDTADFGVPQRRRRMILMCSRIKAIAMPAANPIKRTVRQAIGNMRAPAKSKDALHRIKEAREERTLEIIRLIPKDGGSRSDLPEEFHLPCHRRLERKAKGGGFKDVYGRMRWDDVSPTITGGCASPSKGRFLHPSQNRCISLREAAVLQTFPRKYKFPVKAPKQDIALMIGNALPPAFIKKHALAIKAALKAR